MADYVRACRTELARAVADGSCPRHQRVLRRGHTVEVAGRRAAGRARGRPPGPRGRGHRRVQPRGRRRGPVGRLPGRRGHPDVLRHPVHRPPRAGGPGPAPPGRRRRPVHRGGGRGRVRHLQSGPDLRRGRGVRRRLGPDPGRGHGPRPPAAPRERLRPDRRAGHAPGPRPGTPPDDDVQAGRYEAADRRLAQAGYRWEEISNWARPGHGCRHNRLYWRQGDYLGVGQPPTPTGPGGGGGTSGPPSGTWRRWRPDGPPRPATRCSPSTRPGSRPSAWPCGPPPGCRAPPCPMAPSSRGSWSDGGPGGAHRAGPAPGQRPDRPSRAPDTGLRPLGEAGPADILRR